MAAHVLLNNTPGQREELFIGLYKKAFPTVASYVSKMGGSFDDAKDIFQDALVIYYEKMVSATIEINVNENAYLLGIAKHLWAAKFREEMHCIPLDAAGSAYDFIDDNEPQPSTGKLITYLETAGQKCMEILRAFYYDKLPADKIAGLFGYSGIRSATVQKYKCMEKVRETIKEKSLAYEDFIE